MPARTLRRPTLGERIAALDAEHLVGRRRELSVIDAVLSGWSPARVLLVHGPGGIGKSALLRAAARRAAGASVHAVAVGDLDPGALADALAPALEAERPLVLLDDADALMLDGAFLRRELLPALSDQAAVIVAGRREPAVAWFRDGWELITQELELRGLSRTEAHALLALRGHVDDRAMQRLAADADGSPLALTLAPVPPPGEEGDGGGPYAALLRQLVASERDPLHDEALAVMAIAREVTPELLADVLGPSGRESWSWLAGRSFVETVGLGLRMHPLPRRALLGELRRRQPERERALRRRVVDHLYARAAAGRPELADALGELVTSRSLRWIYGCEAPDHHIGQLHAHDFDPLGAAMDVSGRGGWWRMVEPVLRAAPALARVARDASGQPCGLVVSTTPAGAPRTARADPAFGPALREADGLQGDVVVVHTVVDLTRGPAGDIGSPVTSALSTAALVASGAQSVQYALARYDARTGPWLGRALTALGARHVGALDVATDGTTMQAHLIDFGDGGVLAGQRRVVYRELGLPVPPDRPIAPSPPDREAVRDALRALDDPVALAASPFARGTGVEERSASVRAAIEAALGRAFGDTPRDQELRQVIVAGYLEGGAPHEEVAAALFLSRATYFRRLRAATERLTEAMLSN